MTLKTFHVGIPAIHITTVEVRAETEDEARSLAANDKGRKLMEEFSHFTGQDEFRVDEVEEPCEEPLMGCSCKGCEVCGDHCTKMCQSGTWSGCPAEKEQQRRDEKNGLYGEG